jgi:hypothetical protein
VASALWLSVNGLKVENERNIAGKLLFVCNKRNFDANLVAGKKS